SGGGSAASHPASEWQGPLSTAAARERPEADGHGEVARAGEPLPRARAGAFERLGAPPEDVRPDLGAAQPRERPPVARLAPCLRNGVSGGEREPHRPVLAEQLARVGRRGAM